MHLQNQSYCDRNPNSTLMTYFMMFLLIFCGT